jgi:hypothetical protein
MTDAPASNNAKKVFISYSHDTDEQRERVLAFANALRSHGVDAELDRYHVRPPKGWPRWCEEQLGPEVSRFILVICTPIYRERVEDKVAANEGRGVYWEGALIYNYLYDQKANTRFIPVLFPGTTEKDIPRPLRDTTRYHVAGFDFSDAGYKALYRELTDQAAVRKPELGDVVTLGGEMTAPSGVRAPLPEREVVSDLKPSVEMENGDCGRLRQTWDRPRENAPAAELPKEEQRSQAPDQRRRVLKAFFLAVFSLVIAIGTIWYAGSLLRSKAPLLYLNPAHIPEPRSGAPEESTPNDADGHRLATDRVEDSARTSGEPNQAMALTAVADLEKSLRASAKVKSVDRAAPALTSCMPEGDSIQVPLNTLVTLSISDDNAGVDPNTVSITINGRSVYSGNASYCDSPTGTCRRTAEAACYTYAYQPNVDFDFDEAVTVTATAADLAGNSMSPHSYAFQTEMRSFGPNLIVSHGPAYCDKGNPAVVTDSSGNIWTVWHAGRVGQRNVYTSQMKVGTSSFTDPVQLTNDPGDQSDPDIAVGTDDKLYVVWQDNRRGNWDIYASTSVDGATWSTERRITDSEDNQTAPALVIDSQSPNGAHVAYEDDGAGNQDIHIATSKNNFANMTFFRVTSSKSIQADPDIAVDASNTVYLVWTDSSSSDDDIYGAASHLGPWAHFAVASGPGNQNSPAIAAEASGSVLHFVWVDDCSGDRDIRCTSWDASSGSPPTEFVTVDAVDGTDQLAPDVIVTGGVGEQVRAFVCWQDWRNVTGRHDTDVYFVELKGGATTNVLVGDAGTNSDQSEPVMGIDLNGYPFVIWTDGRKTTKEIYYAGSTYVGPTPVASQLVIAASGGTIGNPSPRTMGDVSVFIPPGACPHDVTISIRKILNAQSFPTSVGASFEFSPSGLQFNQPVTITIPYAGAQLGDSPSKPYWYDSRTNSLSTQGTTGIENLVISPTLNALRFKTTHFSPYVLLCPAVDNRGIPRAPY